MGGTALIVHLLAFSTPHKSNVVNTVGSDDSVDNKNLKESAYRRFQNEFLFVPYGGSAPSENGNTPLKMISCDGKVPGTNLDLTHWTDNTTPDTLYADTSTEIALNFAASRLLFISAAESGDFGEWTSDEGLMLDCALESILYDFDDEASAYNRALDILPSLLSALSGEIEEGSESRIESFWKEGLNEANDDWDAVQSGRVIVSKAKAGRMALVMEEERVSNNGQRRLGSYALYRALRDLGLAGGQPGAVTRVLRATLDDNNDVGSKRWKYEYEMPGHGWVKRLVSRETVPHIDADCLSSNLNEKFPKSKWASGGSSGLVSICHTIESSDVQPETLMNTLLDLDEGLR
mmetsp:Transcript_14336/g.20090  ORF Transcript_14336/g.20090 Transcript_14336/m.20090 type:complete len:348 (+) Transcript_14336:96-1139(+)